MGILYRGVGVISVGHKRMGVVFIAVLPDSGKWKVKVYSCFGTGNAEFDA